ncbi:MAG: hypothetical protein WD940_01805 [Patescibacteria group bacterium]
MFDYLVLIGAFAFVIGILVVLDRLAGKDLDRWVNSLPRRAQLILLVAILGVLALLWILFGR